MQVHRVIMYGKGYGKGCGKGGMAVALQIGDRVSVQTRAWGNEYARSVHGGRRFLTGRTLGTVVGEVADGKLICNFGEEQEDGQHASWEATALLRVQTVDELLTYLTWDTCDAYAATAATWLARLRTPDERLPPLPTPPADGSDAQRAALHAEVHRLLETERQQRRLKLAAARDRRRDVDRRKQSRDTWHAANPDRNRSAAARQRQANQERNRQRHVRVAAAREGAVIRVCGE